MTERRLPVKQLVILSICRFAEPLALTSVFPYIPEMMESFGVPENDIARWAGLTSAIFSICQAVTGIPWGAASDRFGRKPIILVGLFNTMLTMLLFGFSTSLPMAIAARGLQGLGNGNVGILRTTVAELCPWKELQPRAFSIMPLVFTIGAIFGPSLGGALSNPLGIDPRGPKGDRFLERFPYAPPNIVAAAIFAVGIITGWLFLKESMESKKHDRDVGLIVGAKITSWYRRTFNRPRQEKKLPREREPLLAQPKLTADEENDLVLPDAVVREEPPRMREVLSYQTTLNLVVYSLLAMYSIAYDQLLPVYMHHPAQATTSPSVSLPLKFTGGFGIDSRRIGIIFTIYSIICMLFQFLIFPPLTRRLGVLRCLRISFLIYPAAFFVTPFLSLLPTDRTRELGILFVLVVRGLAGTFAFPTSTIMITNSAPSLRVLGTINGLATSLSAVGRAAGPALGGNLFTYGVKQGYIIIPFWALTAFALLAWVPTLWLVEGEGFGDDSSDDEDSSSDMDGEDDAEGQKQRQQTQDEIALESESEYGEPTQLLRAVTTTSAPSSEAAILSDYDPSDEEAESRHRARRQSRSQRSHSQSARRRSRSVRTRSSVPIGMGMGFRRLSSNLGSTGVGGGGSVWGVD
ncbi:MFS general substrate transporter [Periconia macrospinosa]|uniref:MFS general substrate transporter n=1 Tax=Periconia macrospinosa TaxID=97972 RepID=A0A2V1DCV1_9PLEO|nr:MFS general substrate transporter [Periconia macrospinosa]